MERYFHKHYLGDRVATHHSSFGCPFACNFCAVVGMSNRKWVAQSPDRVGRVLEQFSLLYRADAVQFHDMDFFISESRTQAIAERLTPLGMAWWALGRVDELMRYKDATWTAMRRSGLKMVFCGAESGSTEMLKRMNKGGTASADLTIELARRISARHRPQFSFVVGKPPILSRLSQRSRSFADQTDHARTDHSLSVFAGPMPERSMRPRAPGVSVPDTLEGWVSDRWRRSRSVAIEPPVARQVRQKCATSESAEAYYPTVTKCG